MRVICLLAAVFVFIYGATRAHAESLTVSLSVGDTFFAVNGYTSPGAMVTLKESGAIQATTTADSTGYFEISILDTDGLHTYDLYATDIDGGVTDTVTQNVSLTPGNTTTIGNLILPPTFAITSTSTPAGTDIYVTGYTVPNSEIQIFLNNSIMSTVQVGADGHYNGLISTNGRESGTYTVFVRAALSSGYSSNNTASLSFILHQNGQPGTGQGQGSSGSTVVTLLPTPTPTVPSVNFVGARTKPWWFSLFDSDGDTFLTLRELLAIVTEWARELQAFHKTPPEQRSATPANCDLNRDSQCDVVDFSVLLYYVDR